MPLRLPKWTALKPAATFCYVWLMLGFFTGTLLLLGPVGWLTAAVRARSWEQRAEDLLVDAIIALYVIASAGLAWRLVRRMDRCQTRRGWLVIPAAMTIAAALCLWGWMNPANLAAVAGGTASRLTLATGAEFDFGPYPNRQRLEDLKRQGFTAVVSLQHPAVVPFEGPSIAEEMREAQEVGLPFIDARMLPWISGNEESLSKIRDLARRGTGRYYVHCGLGRDRVNVVKHVLEAEGVRTATDLGYLPAKPLDARLAPGRPPFERGRIYQIEPDVWVIPYPNKHEFFAILGGQVQHVIVALNQNDPTEREWIDQARRIFAEFKVPFEVLPIGSPDPDKAALVVNASRRAPHPTAVIVSFTDPNPPGMTQVASILLRTYGAHPH